MASNNPSQNIWPSGTSKKDAAIHHELCDFLVPGPVIDSFERRRQVAVGFLVRANHLVEAQGGFGRFPVDLPGLQQFGPALLLLHLQPNQLRR